MVSAVSEFEGAECLCHTIGRIVDDMYKETPELTAIDKRIRGLCTHFRHSVLGNSVLRELQQRHAIPLRTAPGGAGTRWTGRPEQAQWLADNAQVIPIYDVERACRKLKCAPNPDGTTYGNHQLCTADWAAVPGLCSLLEPFKEATLLAEASKRVTGSLVLPLVSSMYISTSAEAQFYHHATGEVLNDVPEFLHSARTKAHDEIERRFFVNLDISKVEDFALATALDPRFKNLDFPGLELWLDGALTKS